MNQVRSFSELPIQQKYRKCTDVFCWIVCALFFMTLLILSCTLFNGTVINQWRYPKNSINQICGIKNKDFPYLYFASINDQSKRICLSQCPQMLNGQIHSQSPNCDGNICEGKQIDIYDTKLEDTLVGSFCFPTDPSIKDKIIQSRGIKEKLFYSQHIKMIVISLTLAIVIGIIFLIVIQTFPGLFINISIIGATVLLIILGILFLVLKGQISTSPFCKYLSGVICLLFGISLSIMMTLYKKQLKINNVFILQSGNALKNNPYILYITPWVIILGYSILSILFFYQYVAFFSLGNIVTNHLTYYQIKHTFGHSILLFLNCFGTLWGFNIIRQSGSFILSAFAIRFYQKKSPSQPIKNSFYKHVGSIIACAFMVSVFGVLDVIYLYFMPNKITENKCSNITKILLTPLSKLSVYIRQQAMAYTHLLGIPYCNSAVYCQMITQYNEQDRKEGCRPIVRYYKFAIYSFGLSLILIFAVVFQFLTVGNLVLKYILVAGFLSYFVLGAFTNIHSDFASSFSVFYKLEKQFPDNLRDKQSTHSKIKKQIQTISN